MPLSLTVGVTLAGLWLTVAAIVVVARSGLLKHTWNEPYIKDLAVVIESDDWGGGPKSHAERLDRILRHLAGHRDRFGRVSTLTANMVLAVPDFAAMKRNGFREYVRTYLDEDYGYILKALRAGMKKGSVVPQLHGLEHLNGAALTSLAAAGDPRIEPLRSGPEWGWESLPSPLQGHYVDGSTLPTKELPRQTQERLAATAANEFARLFGFRSASTVAPCYLWDGATERAWGAEDIGYIQTAGYRCTGRDGNGAYIQAPQVIRAGDRGGDGQTYLVRTIMYEPRDGRDSTKAKKEAEQAARQALPLSICTHRYNYTGAEEAAAAAIAGLDEILRHVESMRGRVRYLSSPELGAWLAGEPEAVTNPATGEVWPGLQPLTGVAKIRPFLWRLWYRHAKLRWLALATGLVLPAGLLALVASMARQPQA